MIPPEAVEFSSLFMAQASKNCIWSEVDGVKVLRMFSKQGFAVNVALTIVMDSDQPIPTSQIEKVLKERYPTYAIRNVLNRMQDAPGVFPFSHGTWGCIRHIGLTDAEMKSVKIYIRDALRNIERDQFHGAEIYEYISQFDPVLRKKLTEFSVSGLVRHLSSAVYLGRSMFSKTGNKDRLQIHDLVVQSLEEHEFPLKLKKSEKVSKSIDMWMKLFRFKRKNL